MLRSKQNDRQVYELQVAVGIDGFKQTVPVESMLL